jgi:hypothetical protein
MIREMSPTRANLYLAYIWISFFLLSLGILLWLLFSGAIEDTTFPSGIEDISTLYVPYLGAILGFYFATRAKTKSAPRVRKGAFVTALVVSATWNLVVFILILLVPMQRLDWEAAIKLADSTGSKLSWLVAPVMGYYFGKSDENPD